VRAIDAVRTLNDMSKDLIANNLSRWADREPLRLTPDNRRNLLDAIAELKQTEMYNAAVIMKMPGYHNQPIYDTAPIIDKIEAISPQVADEIATRYAAKKIYTTQAVALAYPQMERALLRDGSEADLAGLAADAKAEGYEFYGEPAKRPMKRRVVIPAQTGAPRRRPPRRARQMASRRAGRSRSAPSRQSRRTR
jgi:hypothetical protein